MKQSNAQAPILPGLDSRTVICGMTGTGKSVGGAWHLLRYREDYPSFPWVIFNPKRDDLLDAIGAEPLDLSKGLPRRGLRGGMAIFHPVAESDDDDEAVNSILHQAMEGGNVGLYFDEGYSIPSKSKPFRRVLTQGRSRRVPAIVLSQRPVYMDKFVFTEANFHRIFYLQNVDDRKRVKENTGITIGDELPPFCSYWYDVAMRRVWDFSPGPSDDVVKQGFEDLKPKKRGFFR